MRYLAIFCWLLAFVSVQPASAASSPGLQPLELELAGLLADKSGNVGIAALDLSTGQMVSIRGDVPFPMASTVKIAVAANYLSQVEHGRRSLDDVIQGESASALMKKMLVHSDNRATDKLLKDLGGPDTLQQWLTEQHITGLRIDRTIAQLLAAKRDLWDIRDSSTPHAMVDLLRRIDQGKLLKPWSRNYLLNLMAQCQTGKNRMKSLLPAGTRVEHKTGTLNGLSDDVGFITLPSGRRLAVAFFARGGTNRPRTIAEAARTIYDGFMDVVRGPFTTAATALSAR
jgi:beta-lactamase class A